MKSIYPFSAIVGQEKMKLALILSVINPSLGGVLIRGEKGTAKSTAVRALSALLPEQEVVIGCIFACDPNNNEFRCDDCLSSDTLAAVKRKRPLVELPIGATEDRLLGSIDLEKAISSGISKFEPGILAMANRGILYVDEVNLLDDHLVDSLLDAAAMGRNIVEREGISISHPARFTLIGTMNPEEGELRPQLLDRFGLCVEVKGIEDLSLRQEVIKNRLAFEHNPYEFCTCFKTKDEELGRRIECASEVLNNIILPDEVIDYAVKLCLNLDVDGHRGDITVIKTAITLTAWRGDAMVSKDDVLDAAELALPHRMRRKPFEDLDFDVRSRLEDD